MKPAMDPRCITKWAVYCLVLGLGMASPRAVAITHAAPPPNSNPPLVVTGWLPHWSCEEGVATLTGHMDVLQEVSPFCYGMRADGTLALCKKPEVIANTLAVARAAKRPVIPTIDNGFDPKPVRAVITNPTLRAFHIQTLVDEAVRQGYSGLDIDYENLYADDREAFTGFIRELSGALHAKGLLLTIDVPAKTYEPGKPGAQRAFDYAALGTAVDEFRVMAYNWSWSGGTPGPIAPYWWVRQVLEFTKTQVDPGKIMLGVPLYGYNWPARGGRGSSLTGDDVSHLLATYNPVIHWDKSNREHWFTFVSKQTRKKRIVWFSDRDSVAERRQLAQEMGIKGIAVWALGKEDQTIWSSLNP